MEDGLEGKVLMQPRMRSRDSFKMICQAEHTRDVSQIICYTHMLIWGCTELKSLSLVCFKMQITF